MAQNTGIDTVNDDDLEDEALDRTNAGKSALFSCCCVMGKS